MAARKYIWLILLAVVVLGLTLVSAVVKTRNAAEAIADRSSYRFNTLGTRALFETLRRLGYRVQRCRDDLRAIPPDVGQLWIIHPTHPFDREEIAGLRRWVVRGNVLVCAYDALGFGMLFGPEITLRSHDRREPPPFSSRGGEAPRASRRSRARPGQGSARGSAPLACQAAGKEFEELASILPEVRSALPLMGFGPGTEHPEGERLAPRSTEGLVADVGQVYIPNRLRVYPPEGHTEVVGDRTGSVIVSVPVEAGRIIFISDPDAFANQYLLQEDNVILAANIAQLSQGKRILFDEFHHGFEEVGSLPQLAWRSASRWGILQLALAALLLLISQVIRFGRPLPMPVTRRRMAQEYVESLAEVYRAAQAREVAVWTLYQFTRRRLAALAGLPPEAEDDLLARQAAPRIHRPAEEIRQALTEARRLSAACPDDGSLVQVARNLRLIVEPMPQGGRGEG